MKFSIVFVVVFMVTRFIWCVALQDISLLEAGIDFPIQVVSELSMHEEVVVLQRLGQILGVTTIGGILFPLISVAHLQYL